MNLNRILTLLLMCVFLVGCASGEDGLVVEDSTELKEVTTDTAEDTNTTEEKEEAESPVEEVT